MEGEKLSFIGNQGDFQIQSAVADGKTDIFELDIQPGLMQGSVTHHIAVTHVACNVVVAGDTVKNRSFIVVNRIFPLIQNRRIML